MNTIPATREMRRAIQRRDATYDGIFFLAVRTTGVFCRPSCPARRPRPENVSYFATAREALFAGYRPCKRCRPMEISGRPPGWVAALLGEIDRSPTVRLKDADLRARGVDPARARRYFQNEYGMTFQAYTRARRLGKALSQIRDGEQLTEVALGNGFQSQSGFRDAFGRTFGGPPGRSREADCIVTAWVESPLGPLVVGANSQGVSFVEFTDRRMFEKQFDTLRRVFRCAVVPGENDQLALLRQELAGYFAGTVKQFSVPLVYPGSPFQRRVWEALLQIPYGQTRSYDAIAREIGAAGSARAVGHANGLNRIAILIPCHRVVNKNGELGGYGGGLWRKEWLLSHERRCLDQSSRPKIDAAPLAHRGALAQ